MILGHSVEGRPILGYQVDEPSATRRLLAAGCVHGDETADEAITPAVDVDPSSGRGALREIGRASRIGRGNPGECNSTVAQPGSTDL